MEEEFQVSKPEDHSQQNPRQNQKNRAKTTFIMNVQEYEEQQLKQLQQKNKQFQHSNSYALNNADTQNNQQINSENQNNQQQQQPGNIDHQQQQTSIIENGDQIFTNSQLSIKIPEFEVLEQPQNKYNKDVIIQLVKHTCNDTINWLDQYNTVHELRQWNKFYSKQFCNEILEQVITEIMLSCENLRSTISRASLKLIKEILQLNSIDNFSENTLNHMIVKIFEKANFDKHFLRKEANGAIECLEKNDGSLRPEVIRNLCILNFDKNGQLCEMACQSLSNILKQNRENLKQIKNWEVLNVLVKTLAKNLEGKRAKLKNTSKELCQFLNGNLNESIFESLEQDQKKLVKSCLQDEKKSRSRNFKDFLKNNQSQLQTQKSTSSNNNLSNHNNNNNSDDIQIDMVLQKSQSSNANFNFCNSNKLQEQSNQQDNNKSSFLKFSQNNTNSLNNINMQQNNNNIYSNQNNNFSNNIANSNQNQNQNLVFSQQQMNINNQNIDILSNKAQIGSNILSQDSEFNSNKINNDNSFINNSSNNNSNYIYYNNTNNMGNNDSYPQKSKQKMQDDSVDII